MYYKYCQICDKPSYGKRLCKDCEYEVNLMDEIEYEPFDFDFGNNRKYRNRNTDDTPEIISIFNDATSRLTQIIESIIGGFSYRPQARQYQAPKEKPRETVYNQKSYNVKTNSYRKRKYKTAKGFYVRSKDELMISDFLTENGIYHIYEKRFYINNEEYFLPDFYIKGPVKFNERILRDVYIEHWGVENNEDYDRKRDYEKIPVYRQAGITLINTYPDDITNYREILTYKLTYYKEHQINYEKK